MNDLTVSGWAQSIGISKQAGYNAVKRCGIPVVDGRVDAEVATALYRRRTRARVNASAPAAVASTASTSVAPIDVDRISYEEASRRRQVAEAQIAEFRLLQERGTLVHVEKVRSRLASMLSTYRTALLQIPDRLAPTLAAESDAKKVRDELEAELRIVMTNLVQWDVA